ncbi:MAG: exonuclease domain-containing protein, partial [Ignavibacteria bacterium]
QIVDTYSTFINPGVEIPFFITDLTGITNDDVRDAPFFEDITNDILTFFGDSVLTAHNLQFDISFLKNELMRAGFEFVENPQMCTLKIARKLYPELKSKSLGNLVKYLKILHKNVHRGLGDAIATAKILLKMIDKLKEEHHVETLSDLINFQALPSSKSSFRMIKKKLVTDLSKLPESPGVYFFKGAKEEIKYIGKAKNLSKRVKNYFSNTASRKAKKIVRLSSRLSFYKTNTELTALLTEADLIKQNNPPLNDQLKRYSQSFFIKVETEKNFPSIKVTSKFDFDGNDYFGPYNSRDTAVNLKEIIEKTFQLRECTEKEFQKNKKCYLADIERCLAPCIDKGITENYKNETEKVFEFLSGNNQLAVNRLLNKMKYFSERQKYEEAAEIRDIVNSVLNQLNKSSIISEPINNANLLIEVQGFPKNDYLLMIEGKVFIKDYFGNEHGKFENAMRDYFDGAIHLFNGIDKKDFEKIKISLSWMVKNRDRVKVYYLKNFETMEELLQTV